MDILFNADEFIKFLVKSASAYSAVSGDTSISLISSLAAKLKGVQLGFSMNKVAPAAVKSMTEAVQIPPSIWVGGQKGHVQGLAVDTREKCIYMSFTTVFYKVDYKGNVLASVERIHGHLGDMVLDTLNRKVYASLECKDDVIGKGVDKQLGVEGFKTSTFYLAVIDIDAMNAIGQDASEVMKFIKVAPACEDYAAEGHRYGCSGIDGVALGPLPGNARPQITGGNGSVGKDWIYVAYGIYSDLDRTDNNNQVILRYSVPTVLKKAKTEQENAPSMKPAATCFAYTGNTNWGVQNLDYDPWTGYLMMAVYKGKKPGFPNYDLYAIDMTKKVTRAVAPGLGGKRQVLQLAEDGLLDEDSGIRGWRFKYGSTGLNSLGGGMFLISQNMKVLGKEGCKTGLYRWTGSASKPFKSN